MKRYFLLCFSLGCFFHLSAQCPTSGNTVTVTTTASSGVGSLADAINCANTRPAVVNIAFNIPGPALKIIQPTSPLPTLSKAGATIDGTTQGSTVILDGTLLTASGNGLTLSGNNITVQGLYIRNFNTPSGNGINVVSGNGTDISGNTIAGNRNGITINTAALSFTISGNTFGETTGGGALANSQHAINILGVPTSGVVSNNTIANSGAVGVNAGNGNVLITDNSIYCNTTNGIVRGTAAPAAPVITRANTQQIRGTAASGRVIEVFSHSTTGCTNAPCQGRTLLGIVTTPANGVWILDLSAGQVAGGARVTATSTQNGNNTSVFSACATVTNCATLNVNTTVGNVTCNGANNGSATATATGGSPVAAYTYVWSNGATGSNITGLAPGTYTVTVTDAAGCTDSATASVSQPSALGLSINTQNATCTGTSTGSAVAAPSGGSPPYIAYRWSTGQTTVSINNIPAGTYTVTVTDRQGCTISQNASVGQPTALGLVLMPQNAACFGGSTGSVTASANGGTPTYSYVWGNGQTGPTATNLAAGTYTATATDAQGCTIVQNSTVGEPPVLMVALSSTPETAFNANNGTAMAMAEGGVGGYTYLWSNGQATPTIFNLAPGVYTCTVRDANNCTQTASTTVNAFVCAGLSVTLNASDVTCNGLANGNVAASPSGSSGYTYLWSNGATTVSIGNLAPGTYTCTITDAAGCTVVASASIGQPPALSLLLTPQNLACFGQATGAVSANANGGTPPYNYIWSNGQTTQNLANLPAGTYSLTITDQAACTLVRNSTVGGPPQLTLALSNTPETAANANNGTATASPAGGTPSYTYIWSNGQTTIQITSLAPGTYTCTVRDANNCTQTATTTVGAFGCNVGLALNAVNVTCNGLANGSITAVPSGGNGHTYVWNTGATSATVNNLAPGTYTCTVRDANNCTAVQTASVTQPPVLSVNLSNTPETAANANNGTATASPAGGTPSYTYIWSNGQTTIQITSLAPGTYTCTVRDANNCTQMATTTVGAFGCNVGLALNAVNVTCNGLANGSITAVPNGGTGHTYLWNTGSTSATVNNLAPGTYTCTVRDANNCTAVQTASVTQPPVLSPNLSKTDETAANAKDGTATAAPTGGIGSYQYLWNNGQTTNKITNLSPGTYTCTVRDANNCTAVAAVSVLSGGSAACATRPVYAVLVPSEVCGNEPFTLEIDELYPNALLRYAVYLPNGDSLFIAQTKVSITPTSTAFSGEYFVVRDSLGCRSKAVGGAPVRVVSFAKGALWAGRDTLLCTAVPITLRGNAPLNQSGTWVSLGKAIVESPGTAQTTVRGLVPGPNLFVWKVALPACPNAGADTVQVFLETPPRLGDDRYTLSRASDVAVMEVLLNDQLIGLPDTLVRQIGTPETGTLEFLAAEKRFRYTVDEDFRGTVKFRYAVCVETASPCGFECDTALVTIEVLNLPKVPEGLVVEDPGPNGELTIKGTSSFERLELYVFNRWGDLVYFSKAYSNDAPWRGDFSGKSLPQGAYYYHLKVFEKDNKQVGDTQKGVIYLVERE